MYDVTPKIESKQEEIDLSNFNILLVEDNKINQQVALRMLKKFNAKVEVANNGQEAVDFVEMRPFDLIIMDLQMPMLDGISATKIIRDNQHIVQPLIIALTANATENDRNNCFQVGMEDFIAKPIKLNVLRNYMKKWLL